MRSTKIAILHAEHVEVSSDDRLTRDIEQPTFPEFVGLSEIAERLGVSKQRVGELRPRLPKPVTELRSGPIWQWPAIERFVKSWARKPGRPPRTDTAAEPTAPYDRTAR